MNKIATTLIGILAIMFFTGNVYAAGISNTAAGGLVTVAATSTTGAGAETLTFTPSPGIIMGGLTTATNFTVISANIKAEENAVAFAMLSGTPTIYQAKMVLDSTSLASDLPTPTAGTEPSGYSSRN